MTVTEVVAATGAAGAGSIRPEHIDEVRKHVDAEYHPQCDDATVQRFIRATGGHHHLAAAKRLQHTCAWRKEKKPETIVCKACAKNPRSHYMHVSGFDKANRPLIYSCQGLASNKVYDDNRDHMISTFETAIKCMPPSVQQWVWVCDFYGFGLRDVNPSLAKLFLEISADHYPERLGLFLVVGAPTVFNLLWSAIEHLVDKKTRNKIRFMPFDPISSSKKGHHAGRLEAELAQHFDEATALWLMQEMAQNRDHATAAQKALVGSDRATHNCHGCAPLLARYEADPALLDPQASAAAV